MEKTQLNRKRLVQRIKRKITRKMSQIINGYIVVWTEADGCDEYGIKYWVECKNGFSGRSWDVRPATIKAMRGYFKDILENGIEYNRVRYYIKDDIFNQIFDGSFASKLYRNSMDYKFNITLIDDESEIKAVKEQITCITSFVDFIKTKIKQFDENNKQLAFQKLEKYKKSANYVEPMILGGSLEYLNFLQRRPEYIENFIKDSQVAPFTSYEVFNNGMGSNYFIKKYYDRYLENPFIN